MRFEKTRHGTDNAKIIEEARRTDLDYLLFLDSDMAIPAFTLRKLVRLRG